MKLGENFQDAPIPYRKCAEQYELKNLGVIEQCVNTTESSKLLQRHGETTQVLKPELTFVPTIVIKHVNIFFSHNWLIPFDWSNPYYFSSDSNIPKKIKILLWMTCAPPFAVPCQCHVRKNVILDQAQALIMHQLLLCSPLASSFSWPSFYKPSSIEFLIYHHNECVLIFGVHREWAQWPIYMYHVFFFCCWFSMKQLTTDSFRFFFSNIHKCIRPPCKYMTKLKFALYMTN